MKLLKYISLLASFIFSCINVNAQMSKYAPNFERNVSQEEIDERRLKVEAAPSDSATNQHYINGMLSIKKTAQLIEQYKEWIKKYPKSKNMPFAIGNALAWAEDPAAKPFLLQAVKFDPNNIVAWYDLYMDAQRWGEFEQGKEYLRNAMKADPNNAEVAVSYVFTLKKADGSRDLQAMKALYEKFKDNDAIGNTSLLYNLGLLSENDTEKEKYYSIIMEKYPKSPWGPMIPSIYFAKLLETNPAKAIDFAEKMEAKAADSMGRKLWIANKEQALSMQRVNALEEDGKYEEAIEALSSIKPSRMFSIDLIEMEAKFLAKSGKIQLAYDKVFAALQKQPSAKKLELLYQYGSGINKSKMDVTSEVQRQFLSSAEPATDFSLRNYLTKKATSLQDYKGKVILLTYWFPGCGPCRGEFPHFENVLKRYNSEQIAYLAINVDEGQNDYVLPFVKQSKVTFTPLEDVDRDKGNLDNRRAAPVNFLIDKEGKLVFSKFRIGENNREDLIMMIDLLLDKG